MIFGIGTDIIEVKRIQEIAEKYGDKFLKRIFTEREIEYCNSFNDTKYIHFAARFAAKESFSKAIGTGITQGFKFKEFGIINESSGRPIEDLSGDLAIKYSQYKFHISLSHTEDNAVAFVVMEDIAN